MILVDDYDREIGHLDKLSCHLDHGLLHRAFSLFIFNRDGDVLMQQRSQQKKLWPLYWSNSCCSHPVHGETIENSIDRRLQQELGFNTRLKYLYKFKYQATYLNIGSEHELCSVFVGCTESPIKANTNEIAAWRFISATDLKKMMLQYPNKFTPWFKLEWHKLITDYADVLCNMQVYLS